MRQICQRELCAVAQHLALIIIDSYVARTVDKPPQLFARKHRQSLPGIEHERNSALSELRRMLQHALATVGRYDAELDRAICWNRIPVRIGHRARGKRSDLIVIDVGSDEGLRRERAVDLAHE